MGIVRTAISLFDFLSFARRRFSRIFKMFAVNHGSKELYCSTVSFIFPYNGLPCFNLALFSSSKSLSRIGSRIISLAPLSSFVKVAITASSFIGLFVELCFLFFFLLLLLVGNDLPVDFFLLFLFAVFFVLDMMMK